MTIQTCEHCFEEYDTETVSIPTPIPDHMCAFCGTQHTEDKVKELVLAHCDKNGIDPETYGYKKS